MYRELDPEKIRTSIQRLEARIRERFPDSGLAGVAGDLVVVARDVIARSREMKRPIIALRVLVGLLLAAIVAVFVSLPFRLEAGEVKSLPAFIGVLEPALGTVFFVSAFVVFLVSLELRIKRGRVLDGLDELRALAHVVDMHQLTKDPDTLRPSYSPTESSPKRTMSQAQLSRYLDYCIEMLAMVAKIGAIYVQDMNDATVVNAVDKIEELTTGLSRKIWQKIMLLQKPLDLS